MSFSIRLSKDCCNNENWAAVLFASDALTIGVQVLVVQSIQYTGLAGTHVCASILQAGTSIWTRLTVAALWQDYFCQGMDGGWKWRRTRKERGREKFIIFLGSSGEEMLTDSTAISMLTANQSFFFAVFS